MYVILNFMCLFLTMPWIGLQCVIVVFPGHIYLPIDEDKFTYFVLNLRVRLLNVTICLYLIVVYD